MKYNLNDNVKIRISPRGIEHLKNKHERLNAQFKGLIGEFKAPEVDKDGYTKMQLWCVMKDFGSEMGCGMSPIIETDIILLKN